MKESSAHCIISVISSVIYLIVMTTTCCSWWCAMYIKLRFSCTVLLLWLSSDFFLDLNVLVYSLAVSVSVFAFVCVHVCVALGVAWVCMLRYLGHCRMYSCFPSRPWKLHVRNVWCDNSQRHFYTHEISLYMWSCYRCSLGLYSSVSNCSESIH